MQSDNLDAIVALGSASDPVFSYLTDAADVNDAMFTKTRDGTTNIWLGFLEREGVKNPDFKVHLFDRALYKRVFSETNSRELAELEIYLKGLDFLGGGNKRVAIYGRLEFSFSSLLRNELKKKYPELEIVDDQTPTLVDRLRATKSNKEMAKIIEVGRKTSRVMIETRDFISSHRFNKDVFTKPDDSPLTVGDVKRFARSKLLENDLEDSDR
jgi:Xaa-Pro aminopeptidase